MKKRIQSMFILTIIFLGSIPVSSASDYTFTVIGRSEVEQEITVAKLLPFYQYMGGKVEIQWANPDLTPMINKITNILIKEGVRKQDISRAYTKSIDNKNYTRESINLVLKTVSSRNDCLPYRLKSSAKQFGQISCANDDNLDAMKIRK